MPVPDNNRITLDEVKEKLTYDSDTGKFFHKYRPNLQGKAKGWNGRYAGKEITTICPNTGYKLITLNHTRFLAHRIAWFCFYGQWPKEQIDHINGIRHDNRICNLREATHSQNCRNSKPRKRKNGLPKGVIKDGGRKKPYRVYIQVGAFETVEEAGTAYKEAAEKIFGEYAYHLSRGRK